ncbi:unnamed protein product [Calypogeia fissa]
MPLGAENRIVTIPLENLHVSRHIIPRHARYPNCSVQQKPLIIYHGAFQPSAKASQIEAHLRRIGVMEPQWRYSMYPFSHFHSNTHEFLCISNGRARLCFGGEENPDRVEAEVEKGDAMLVPAGVAHRLMDDLRGGFEMVGSYPKGGPQWDMCYGREGEEKAVQRISTLEWLKRDPIYGDEGPVVKE